MGIRVMADTRPCRGNPGYPRREYRHGRASHIRLLRRRMAGRRAPAGRVGPRAAHLARGGTGRGQYRGGAPEAGAGQRHRYRCGRRGGYRRGGPCPRSPAAGPGRRTRREYRGPGGAPPPPVPPPPPPPPDPAASTAEPGERSDEELLREARAYRDELAAKGERVSKEKMRLRFTIGSSKALELARVLREDDQDDTREAVV